MVPSDILFKLPARSGPQILDKMGCARWCTYTTTVKAQTWLTTEGGCTSKWGYILGNYIQNRYIFCGRLLYCPHRCQLHRGIFFFWHVKFFHFMPIFGINIENALKGVQTSLWLVYWFLAQPMIFCSTWQYISIATCGKHEEYVYWFIPTEGGWISTGVEKSWHNISTILAVRAVTFPHIKNIQFKALIHNVQDNSTGISFPYGKIRFYQK